MTKKNELIFDWTNVIENYPADCLDRAKYAKFLTNFLVEKGQVGNYVLNINSMWGAGKTWFLRRWALELEKKHPVVFIDAWKSDHSKDPFLAVIAEIQTGLINKTGNSFIQTNIARKSWRLIKGIAPEITKALIKKYSGIEADKMMDMILSEGDINSLSSFGGKLVETAIKIHEDTNKTIDEFKTGTSEWLKVVIEENNDFEYPLFIFIDELDRCRPTYAIEMLENIKHIFNMENVVFVIATDREQLQHSIKAVYGIGFDSGKYLERFFDRTLSLPDTNLSAFINIIICNNKVLKKYIENKGNHWFISESGNDYISQFSEIFANISNAMEMNLRTVTQWLERLEVIVSNSYKGIDLILLSFLLGFNCSKRDAYLYIKNFHRLESSEGKSSLQDRMNVQNNAVLHQNLSFVINGELLGDKFQLPEPEEHISIVNPYKRLNYATNTMQLFYILYDIFRYEDKGHSLENNIQKLVPIVRGMMSNNNMATPVIETFRGVINQYYRESSRTISDYFELVELASILD